MPLWGPFADDWHREFRPNTEGSGSVSAAADSRRRSESVGGGESNGAGGLLVPKATSGGGSAISLTELEDTRDTDASLTTSTGKGGGRSVRGCC
jgi:hypothetical protein